MAFTWLWRFRPATATKAHQDQDSNKRQVRGRTFGSLTLELEVQGLKVKMIAGRRLARVESSSKNGSHGCDSALCPQELRGGLPFGAQARRCPSSRCAASMCRPRTLEAATRCSSLNPATLNPQPSTLNPRPGYREVLQFLRMLSPNSSDFSVNFVIRIRIGIHAFLLLLFLLLLSFFVGPVLGL